MVHSTFTALRAAIECHKVGQWNWDTVKNCVSVSDYIYSAYSTGTSLLVEGSFHSFVNKG